MDRKETNAKSSFMSKCSKISSCSKVDWPQSKKLEAHADIWDRIQGEGLWND